jgi:hypothetical protein
MNMLFALELSPVSSFVLVLLLSSSVAGLLAFFHIGRCNA